MAIELEYIGQFGGGGKVEQRDIDTDGYLSGNNVRHVLATVTVPEGETWLAAMRLDLTSRYTGTLSSSISYFFVNDDDFTECPPYCWNPAMVVALPAGTHELGVRTKTTSSSYRIAGPGVLYTVKM